MKSDGDVIGFGVAGIQPLGASIRGTYDMVYQFKLKDGALISIRRK
jgi:hypothetical protein